MFGFGTLFDIFLVGVILLGLGYYLTFGLDKQRISNSIKIISQKFEENGFTEKIQYIYDSYLPDAGIGHLAITDRWIIFISRKGKIEVAIQLKDLSNYGYKFVGTGIYQTTVRDFGSMRIGNTAEGKVPVIHFDGNNQYGDFNYMIITPNYKKFYKVLEHVIENGILSKEIKQNEREKEKSQQQFQYENEVILKHMDLIMDIEINELDVANNYFLQNLKVYQDVLYENWTDNILKLNSLNNFEEENLKSHLQASSLRGHRIAIAVLKANEISISQIENQTIPIEIAHKMLQKVNVPDYPAIRKIAYSQYKFYRNVNIDILSEDEVLSIMENYIQIGYKNTFANYLALSELQEIAVTPA